MKDFQVNLEVLKNTAALSKRKCIGNDVNKMGCLKNSYYKTPYNQLVIFLTFAHLALSFIVFFFKYNLHFWSMRQEPNNELDSVLIKSSVFILCFYDFCWCRFYYKETSIQFEHSLKKKIIESFKQKTKLTNISSNGQATFKRQFVSF